METVETEISCYFYRLKVPGSLGVRWGTATLSEPLR